jgi:hypothetical protein
MEQNSRPSSFFADVHTFCALSAILSSSAHSEKSSFRKAVVTLSGKPCRCANSWTMTRTGLITLSFSSSSGQRVRVYAMRYLDERNVPIGCAGACRDPSLPPNSSVDEHSKRVRVRPARVSRE